MLFSNPSSSQTQQILRWHGVCECSLDTELHLAKAALLRVAPISQAVAAAVPAGCSCSDLDAYFNSSKKEIEISAILSIVANNEALVRKDARSRSDASHASGALGGRLRLIHEAVQRDWQVPLYRHGILDAWKSSANEAGDSTLVAAIGRFHELLAFRHWVAHGRYWLLKQNVAYVTSAQASSVVEKLQSALQDFCDRQGWPPFPSA